MEKPSFCTPFPWTIESHPDTEGGYVIREARHEQQTWCDQGYDISLEEGDRRSLLVTSHDAGNIRLLQATRFCSLPCGIWRLPPVQPLRLAPCWKASSPIGSNWRSTATRENNHDTTHRIRPAGT